MGSASSTNASSTDCTTANVAAGFGWVLCCSYSCSCIILLLILLLVFSGLMGQ